MPNGEIQGQNGKGSLPASTQNKLDKLSYDHYKEIGFRMIKDIVEKQTLLLRISTILEHHRDPGKVISETFIKSLDQVGRLTAVKTFIDSEGAQYFMEFVVSKYPYLTLADIQVFCHQIIEGKYGQAFENISAQKLIIWFIDYERDRKGVICEMKQSDEEKSNRIDMDDINHEGLKRMADVFGQWHKKGVFKEENKQRMYLSIDDYIKRNNLNPEKTYRAIDEEFGIYFDNVVKSSNSSKEVADEYRNAFKNMFLNKWLSDKNDELNK